MVNFVLGLEERNAKVDKIVRHEQDVCDINGCGDSLLLSPFWGMRAS